MQDDNIVAISRIGPDLLVSPHVLPLLMEMLSGNRQQASVQQEQLMAHLLTCHYCRTAIIALQSVVQEYDRRNNHAAQPDRDLLVSLVHLSREIDAREAREYERLGAYAETLIYEGQKSARRCFPDIVEHLKICSDCASLVKMTVNAIRESEEC
jgi:hypothetical protein